uniref:Uncharacterized protein n=1 Tax=Tanacetum cinerariifolium TaxID=118510 RepID=A0A6L2MNB0_TANCI|nr:hypothetical protein [Tanacetum cinerariifolium]
MFDTSIFDYEEVVAKKDVSIADPVTTAGEVVTTAGEVFTNVGVKVSIAAITSQIFMDEITLAKALIDIKTSKPKAKGIVMKEPTTPLSYKSPTIVDYKIYKEGRKSFFKIIRADGNSQNYLTFGKMLKNFNREDLEVMWSIVKARIKKTKPMDAMDNLLFQTLKTMFEHHVEDNIWKYQQGAIKVLNWKLFDSCGVYCLTT